MTLLLVEGFDDGLTANKGWSLGGGGVSMTGGRFGGGCAHNSWSGALFSHSFSTVASGTAVLGIAVMLSSGTVFPQAAGKGEKLFQFGIVDVYAMETAQLGLYRSDTHAQIAVSTDPVWQAGVWRYVEVKYELATGMCTVRLDGVTVLSATFPTSIATTGISLGVGTLTYADSNMSTSSQIALYDDIYVLNSSGTTNNDFLGDVQVQTVLPTADGSELGMTPSSGTTHYSLVDEATPNTTDYVSSAVAGTKDTYHFASLAASTGSVFGVQATNYASKDAGGTAGLANITRISGTDYVGANTAALSASWTANSQLWEQNPATSAAWTASQVNSAEFGVQTS